MRVGRLRWRGASRRRSKYPEHRKWILGYVGELNIPEFTAFGLYRWSCINGFVVIDRDVDVRVVNARSNSANGDKEPGGMMVIVLKSGSNSNMFIQSKTIKVAILFA
jgi:hypothetical protein